MPRAYSEALEDYQFKETGLVRLLNIVGMLTVGWPLYLIANVSGRRYDRAANHFDPYSPIFSKRERLEILISDAALIAVVTGLTGLAQSFGWLWLIKARLGYHPSKSYLIVFIINVAYSRIWRPDRQKTQQLCLIQ